VAVGITNRVGPWADLLCAPVVSLSGVPTRLNLAFEERKESAVSTRGVFDDYKNFCEKKAIEVMCPSAFGKLFKKVFPNVTVRRLGPRGENFNHYYNLGRRSAEQSPEKSQLASLTRKLYI